ncbi:MAG: DUF642 domain-containing protein [Chloroflexi bacterium]|nr:DUF642 domain-containing protein [Chloroflexota bacterium]
MRTSPVSGGIGWGVKKSFTRLLIAVLLTTVAAATPYLPAAGQANIVQNGDFEVPPAETPRTGLPPELFKAYAKGETFGGWTVDPSAPGPGIRHIGTIWQAASGKQSVVLSDFDASAIYQDVPTTPGQIYRLRFAMSGSPESGSAGADIRMQVSFGSTVLPEFRMDLLNVPGGHSAQNMGWQYFERDLIATAATTRLRFASLNFGAGDGPTVDDISLTLPGQATPTPTPGLPTPTPAPTPTPPPPLTDGLCPPTAPFFPETGFCIDSQPIQAYFQGRGSVDTFGFPASRTFRLLGFPAQVFQRHVLRVHPDGVKPMNLLDPDVLPVTTVNFATFPGHDAALAGSAPPPTTPNYGQAVLAHLQANVPNTFEGVSVQFLQSYLAAGEEAARAGDFPALVALEIWGFPTSRPARDPNNANFIYQRFQRGILHSFPDPNNPAARVTRGILLADNLKFVLTNDPVLLPVDLRGQVQGSRFFNQYCPNNPGWLCRSAELTETDLTAAIEKQRQ